MGRVPVQGLGIRPQGKDHVREDDDFIVPSVGKWRQR